MQLLELILFQYVHTAYSCALVLREHFDGDYVAYGYLWPFMSKKRKRQLMRALVEGCDFPPSQHIYRAMLQEETVTSR